MDAADMMRMGRKVRERIAMDKQESEPSETKHTPGPWSTARRRLRKRVYAGQSFSGKSGIEGWECSVHVGAENPGNAIAIVGTGGPGAASMDQESVYANAVLIARAPELLADVERLRGEVGMLSRCWRECGAQLKAAEEQRDAIADALLPYIQRWDGIEIHETPDDPAIAGWYQLATDTKATITRKEFERLTAARAALRATGHLKGERP